MAKAKLSLAQMATLRSLRALDDDTASSIRSSMFTSIKDSFNIPAEHKVKVEIDDEGSANFGVIIRKKTGQDYTLTAHGVWDAGLPAPIVVTDPEPAPAPEAAPQSAAEASGKKVLESRWFKVPRSVMAHSIISGGGSFKDGAVDAPVGALLPATGDDARFPMTLTDDGSVHIKLDLVDNDPSDDDAAMGAALIALLSKLVR